jgi:S-adenosylmethionine:tRNA ribosyltransferase-isomerase
VSAPRDASAYDYDLPADRIAQEPLADRSASRLMVVDRASGVITERPFTGLVDLLAAGDVLVRNDTRVVPARLSGVRLPDRRPFEMLLVGATGSSTYRALVRPARRLAPGTRVLVEDTLPAVVVEGGRRPPAGPSGPLPDGSLRSLEFPPGAPVERLMAERGRTPLPPYIRRFRGDPERYQTIYAAREGAVAAPTAGFHFTPEIFDRIRARGVTVVDVTLHVGPGTFLPIRERDYARHRMHAEAYEVAEATSRTVAEARRDRRRVIAVGSTSLRVLETLGRDGTLGRAARGETDLYCMPGFAFGVVDALVTNFHLPRTTLLLLVMAFGGEVLMRRAYARAVAEGFRFYSFGDAMIIL